MLAKYPIHFKKQLFNCIQLEKNLHIISYRNGSTAYHTTQFPHTSAMQAFHPTKGKKFKSRICVIVVN